MTNQATVQAQTVSKTDQESDKGNGRVCVCELEQAQNLGLSTVTTRAGSQSKITGQQIVLDEILRYRIYICNGMERLILKIKAATKCDGIEEGPGENKRRPASGSNSGATWWREPRHIRSCLDRGRSVISVFGLRATVGPRAIFNNKRTTN
ncbi:hypothetical protein B0H10DRAFT_1946804 [Mycena sp. CBHHK59/15]|nr:hypothetical protein B0H10DRAFT_1946804 [Mycena sp. CBHHK59/15]